MQSSHHYLQNEQPTYITLQNVAFSQPTEYFDSIIGLNAIIPNGSLKPDETNMNNNHIHLNIIEQPFGTFRYRYKSEGKKGSHGGIKGESSSRSKKTFPTVKLENCLSSCKEKIIITVSLYTNEPEPKPHVYDLLDMNKGKREKNFSSGKCESKLDENFMAVFSKIAISSRKKEEILEILMKRKISDYVSAGISFDEAVVEMEVQEEIKNINLDSAKLCFEAFSTDDMNTPLCQKVFSSPINNQKSTTSGDLKIAGLSHCAGKCSGGDKVFLLCEKVKKEDIMVRFIEKDDEDEVVWEAYGEFSHADVHHQFAIVFKTPEYYQTNVQRKVYVELFRPSDKKSSEPRVFEYLPDNEGILHPLSKKMPDPQTTSFFKNVFSEISRKRKRLDLEKDTQDSEPIYTTNHLSGSSVMDSPQTTDAEDMDSTQTNADEQTSDDESTISKELKSIFAEFGMDLFPDLPEPLSEVKQSGNVEEQLEDLSACEINGQRQIFDGFNFVNPDCMNQISLSMDSLSIADQSDKKELESQKVQKASKDFVDGMEAVLQNRYLHCAPQLIPLEDENGNNLLHLAILKQNRNWNLIRMMLELVSEDIINHKNKFKETPMHLATKGNHVKILLLLLAKGGDPNLLDGDGNNCLHLAARYGHTQLLKFLLPFKNKRSFKNEINDIDVLNSDGMSALHIAVTRNFKDCVIWLLKFKADVNLEEKKCGQTSLHLALEHPSVFQIILKQPETDVFAEDFRGYTAVYLACLKTGKSFEVVSAQLKDDKNKIIKFLESINRNTEAESNGHSTGQKNEAESDEHLTNSSDFEDSAASTSEVMCMNEKKSSFMKTEEELQKYLDKDDNWKILADFIGLNVQYVEMFDESLSPGQTVLRKFKDAYPDDSTAIIEILKVAGLEEGVAIMQKNS